MPSVEERTADALERLADHYAPRPPVVRHSWVKADWRLMLEAIPGMAEQWKPVPDDYLVGRTVTCVCGHSLDVVDGEVTECECDRRFLADGDRVWAFKPTGEAAD